jgi:hypothetical protein
MSHGSELAALSAFGQTRLLVAVCERESGMRFEHLQAERIAIGRRPV